MKYMNQAKRAAGVFAASAIAMAGSAHAAIDSTALDTGLAVVTTDANTVFTAVLPILLTVLGLSIGLKLLKRFSNKI